MAFLNINTSFNSASDGSGPSYKGSSLESHLMAALSLSDPISFSRSESGVCSEGFQQSAMVLKSHDLYQSVEYRNRITFCKDHGT